MTWDQFAKLWNDYGAFVAICVISAVVLVFVIGAIVKFWPVLTRLVDFIQTLIDLPTRLDSIDTTATAINVTTQKNCTALSTLSEKLEGDDGALVRIHRIEGLLSGVDEKVGIVKHEVRNNGGSSMKDAVDRNSARLARMEEALQRLAQPELQLTATGAIHLTTDGAPS